MTLCYFYSIVTATKTGNNTKRKLKPSFGTHSGLNSFGIKTKMF